MRMGKMFFDKCRFDESGQMRMARELLENCCKILHCYIGIILICAAHVTINKPKFTISMILRRINQLGLNIVMLKTFNTFN